MRAALNIAFGCLLLVMQAMAVLSPHSVTKSDPCKCCACGSQACSVPQTVPAPAPAPIASQRVSDEAKPLAPAKQSDITATVPVHRAALPPLCPDCFLALASPLYQRHCALLI